MSADRELQYKSKSIIAIVHSTYNYSCTQFVIAKKITYVSLRMETGAKASPTTLRDATDLEAAGVLMEVKADAVAAMERTARESFMVLLLVGSCFGCAWSIKNELLAKGE